MENDALKVMWSVDFGEIRNVPVLAHPDSSELVYVCNPYYGPRNRLARGWRRHIRRQKAAARR